MEPQAKTEDRDGLQHSRTRASGDVEEPELDARYICFAIIFSDIADGPTCTTSIRWTTRTWLFVNLQIPGTTYAITGP